MISAIPRRFAEWSMRPPRHDRHQHWVTGAFRGEPDSPAYSASKAARGAFGQSIAKSLGDLGIAVTTLAPGFVDTDMAAASLAGAGVAEIRAQSPFNRVPTAQEVAKAAVILASPAAK